MADLYNSKANLSSFRKTAPQMHPGVARMYPTTGAEKVGEALSKIGQQQHQINVTRQVTNALAQYKMRATDFMAKMSTADPAKVDFEAEWANFMKSQANLTKGMSRDAAQVLETKMTTMGADTYARVKRQEISNTRQLISEEAPDVVDGLVREQAKLMIAGDKKRAQQVQGEFDQWLSGVSPALRPGEAEAYERMYGESLQKALGETEKQMVYNQILSNPQQALKTIESGELKHTTPQQMLTLQRAAEAEMGHKADMVRVLEREMINDQSGKVLDQYLETGKAPVIPDAHEDVQALVDVLNERTASGVMDMDDTEVYSNYYRLKNKLELTKENPVLSEYELLEAAATLPPEKVQELREINEQNKQLLPRLDEAKSTLSKINYAYDKLKKAAATFGRFDKEDVPTILREIEEEKALVAKEVKKRFIQGDSLMDIEKDLRDKIEPASDDMAKELLKFRSIWKRKETEFTEAKRKLPERVRTQTLIHLIQTGEHDREIEAMLDTGWFE